MANYYGDDSDNFVGGYTNYYGGDGRDVLLGTDLGNEIYGGQGNDFLAGSVFTSLSGIGTAGNPYNPTGFPASGNDYLEGGTGDDAAYGADGNDVIYGGDSNDGGVFQRFTDYYFVGGLFGGDGDDLIFGGDGDDYIYGGNGNDTLYGGSDIDWFYFDTPLNKLTNVDRIAGISLKDGDKLVLSRTIFTEIGDTLKNKQFHVGKNATDQKQRFIYNDNNGKIFYDEDGKGGAPKVLFAIVYKDLDMNAGDFVMIA